MSEIDDLKILPEKNMIVLDYKSYNIIKSTVTHVTELTDEEKNKGLILKTSLGGNNYMIEKKTIFLDIPNVDDKNTSFLMSDYGNINIYLSKIAFDTLTNSEKKLYDNDGIYYQLNTKDLFSSIKGSKLTCYVIFDDDNSVSLATIYEENDIKIEKIDNLNINELLVIINRNEIFFYNKKENVDKLDNNLKSNYNNTPIYFYKKKSDDEIEKIIAEPIINENKETEENKDFLKPKKETIIELNDKKKNKETRQDRDERRDKELTIKKNELIDFLTGSGEITSNRNQRVKETKKITENQSDFSRRLFAIFGRKYVNKIIDKINLIVKNNKITYILDKQILNNNKEENKKNEIISIINKVTRFGGGSLKNKLEPNNNTTRKVN
jgi:hypothetical protein